MVECTEEAAVTRQERTRSHIRAAGISVGSGMKAGGTTAIVTVVVSQATIESASMGNMDKAAGTGQSTITHTTPIGHILKAVDTMGGMSTIRGATGETRITDARTAGRANRPSGTPPARAGVGLKVEQTCPHLRRS